MLTSYDKKLIDYIKRNKYKRDLFIINIATISQSGLSRTMKVGMVYKGEFVNITYLAAKLLNKKLTQQEAVRVTGCGMDMRFSLIQDVGHAIFGKGFNATGYCAFQYYKTF